MLESLSPEEAAQLDYDADRLDAPYGTGGKSLLYSFATYRQDGPTIQLEGEYAGIGYSTFSYWVNVKDIRTESLAEKYFAEKEAAHDWQEVQIKGWDQAMYRRYTTNLRQEFHSDRLPDTPEISQQELVLRLGNRVVTVGYTGEADMTPPAEHPRPPGAQPPEPQHNKRPPYSVCCTAVVLYISYFRSQSGRDRL